MLSAILALRHFRYVDSTRSRCKHDTHFSHRISSKESRRNTAGGDVVSRLVMLGIFGKGRVEESNHYTCKSFLSGRQTPVLPMRIEQSILPDLYFYIYIYCIILQVSNQ